MKTNKQIIEAKAKQLVASLNIGEQVAGLSTADTLTAISIRFARLSSDAAKKAAADCRNMATMARKYGCA